MNVWCEIVLYSSTTKQYWNVEELGIMGGCNSVVRALVAQATNLGSIPNDSQFLLHPFSAQV